MPCSAGTVANMAMGLAELFMVWQNPAAAVDANAAMTGSAPAAGASAMTMGTSTVDRAERDWMIRCAAAETTMTPTRNTGAAASPPGATSASIPVSAAAAPESISAPPSASVAAMNSSSDHGTFFNAAPNPSGPHDGRVITSAPRRATMAGCTPWSSSVDHRHTTATRTIIERDSWMVSGPVTGAFPGTPAARSARDRSRRCRRCSRVDPATSTISAAKCDDASASGMPTMSQPV